MLDICCGPCRVACKRIKMTKWHNKSSSIQIHSTSCVSLHISSLPLTLNKAGLNGISTNLSYRMHSIPFLYIVRNLVFSVLGAYMWWQKTHNIASKSSLFYYDCFRFFAFVNVPNAQSTSNSPFYCVCECCVQCDNNGNCVLEELVDARAYVQ